MIIYLFFCLILLFVLSFVIIICEGLCYELWIVLESFCIQFLIVALVKLHVMFTHSEKHTRTHSVWRHKLVTVCMCFTSVIPYLFCSRFIVYTFYFIISCIWLVSLMLIQNVCTEMCYASFYIKVLYDLFYKVTGRTYAVQDELLILPVFLSFGNYIWLYLMSSLLFPVLHVTSAHKF